ncbi:MAG TPA: glycosyltransferase family 87 protein [Acidobacteriota bacterium]
MIQRVRPLLLPLVIALLAAAAYRARIADEMMDFQVYRTAAARALAAEELYRPADGHYQFKYLPAFAVGMAPFAILGVETAQALWFALSVALLLVTVRWSLHGLPARRRSAPVLAGLTVLLMGKFYAHELTLGQANILLATLLVAALLAVQNDRARVAGLLVGLGAFVKPYALILLPWLALDRGLVAALPALAVLLIGLLAPAAIYGWTANLDLLAGWYRTATGSTASNLLGIDNVSLAAMWAKWIGPGSTASALAAATAIAALGLVVVVWRRRRGIDRPEYLEWALLMLLIPLISPQGWDYVLLLGTPAVVCVLDRWADVTPGWRWLTGAALAFMGLTLFDLMGRALYSRFMALSGVSVAALAVAGLLAHLRWRKLA